MTWSRCLIHAILSVGGYILFAAAAVGGGMYLYLQRYESPDKAGHFFNLANKIRYRINCSYLIGGFILSLAGLILGVFQAKNIWRNIIGDAKTIFSSIILIYYAILIGVMIGLSIKKSKTVGRTVSIMAIIGATFLLINAILLNFLIPTVHRYL